MIVVGDLDFFPLLMNTEQDLTRKKKQFPGFSLKENNVIYSMKINNFFLHFLDNIFLVFVDGYYP